MKKLIIVSLMIVLSLVGVSSHNVSAWTWGEEIPYNEFAVTFVGDLDESYAVYGLSILGGSSGIDFTLGSTGNELIETIYGSYSFEIKFLDASSNVIDTFPIEELYPLDDSAQLSGEYTLDYYTLGLMDEAIRYMYIYVPYDYDDTWVTSYGAEVSTYLEDESLVLQTFGTQDYHFEYTYSENIFFRAELSAYIPYDTDVIYIEYDKSRFSNFVDPYSSRIHLYNSVGGLEDTILLSAFDAVQGAILFYIPYDDYGADDVYSFSLELYSMTYPMTHRFLIAKNETISVEFDPSNIREVHYISQGVEVHSDLVAIGEWVEPYEIEPEPENFSFEAWYTATGIEVDFGNMTEDAFPAYHIYLYANYEYIPGTIVVDDVDPTYDGNNPLQPILSDIGWDTTTGYMLLLGSIITVITILLAVVLKVHMIGTVLIDFMILILFHYWGMLPYYVSVVGFIFFAVLAIFAFTGIGGNKNE